MIIIDTNILVRLVGSVNDLSHKKTIQLFRSGQEIFIPDVVFLELQYVLHANYGYERQEIIEFIKIIMGGDNVKYNNYIPLAIYYYASSSIDMADCIIGAMAKTNKWELASFDKKLLNLLD